MTFDDNLGCHDEYEQGRIDNFRDKEEILMLVKELDPQYYMIKFSKYDRP